jgi:hypothetical protein
MSDHTFESILDALATHRQRATYSAVAGVVDTKPRVLMVGRPRDPRHSWVVSKGTGQPTGYKSDQVAPDLTANPEVIASPDELLAWLSRAQ